MKMTMAIIDYIKVQGLDTGEISNATGIPDSKISENTTEALNGVEVLKLCSYLGVRPEGFWNKIK